VIVRRLTMSSIVSSSSAKSGEKAKEGFKPIPQPKETFIVGNLPDIDPQVAVLSFVRLAKVHGPIFQLKFPANTLVVASSQELVQELCDETRFEKLLSPPLLQVRNFTGDGLFTAFSSEKNWTLAHRILVSAFGPLAIKKMQPQMTDIISQMLMWWEHHPGEPFEAAGQFTRLTFVRTLYVAVLTMRRTRSDGVRSNTDSTRSTPPVSTLSSIRWLSCSPSLASAPGAPPSSTS
jgi:cytochrome P450/NADPH-cytochrome P450 reductase